MTDNTEDFSIGEYAKRFLALEDTALPTKIHNALQSIFTKDGGDKTKYQKEVVISTQVVEHQKHYVIKGQSNAIYNALVLFYLLGTGETKKLLHHFHEVRKLNKKPDFSILRKQSDQQYLEFFCLGVQRKKIEQIEQCLESSDFDLFRQKLPSPFFGGLQDSYDITPLLKLYDNKIPWQDYMSRY
ncbi:MAG: hypothetical protein ACI8WB_003775, partial [Phenylobacterium sp.]